MYATLRGHSKTNAVFLLGLHEETSDKPKMKNGLLKKNEGSGLQSAIVTRDKENLRKCSISSLLKGSLMRLN